MAGAKLHNHKGLKLTMEALCSMENTCPPTVRGRKRRHPELTISECATLPKEYFATLGGGKRIKKLHCRGRDWTYVEIAKFLGISKQAASQRCLSLTIEQVLNGETPKKGRKTDEEKGIKGAGWENPMPEFNEQNEHVNLITSLMAQGFKDDALVGEIRKRI